MKRSILIICLLAYVLYGHAQATAKISPIEMMIGEQATVTINANAPEGAQVECPCSSLVKCWCLV